MAFLSKLYGVQVNKAAQLAAHKGIGSLLTFDSFDKFPTPKELAGEKVLCGVLGEGANAIQEYFDYKDTSTKNTYVDAETNVMYRWKHYTLEEWKEAKWDKDEDGKFIVPALPDPQDYINPDVDLRYVYVGEGADRHVIKMPDEIDLLPATVTIGEATVNVWLDEEEKESYLEAVAEYYAALYPTTEVEDASQGWVYVPCAGGGSGASDLYWSKF